MRPDCLRQRQQRRRRLSHGKIYAGARVAHRYSVFTRRKLSPLAQTNRERLNGLPHIELIPAQELEGRLKKGYDIIIEGIFGTGFSGALPTEIATLCRQLNHSDGLKVALDIPTGLNCDTAEADPDTFRADLTYTFAAYKPAHLSESGKIYCQETVCLLIGID